MITIIAAVDDNGIIGQNGDIPWRIPEELEHFKKTTLGHVVIMGRKTWDSLPDGFKPLPERFNLIVSGSDHVDTGTENTVFFDSLETAIQFAESNCQSSFVIGGASIYRQVLDKGLADRILMSKVKGEHEGDVYFPLMTGCWQGNLTEEHDQFDVWEYNKIHEDDD